MQPLNIDTFVFTLIEATVSLYPANADGSAATTEPIWAGLVAETLDIRERWMVRETTPTGAPYPKKHPLVKQYQISIGRVWGLQVSNPSGFVTGNGKYVLDVTWTDEDTGDWHRETFYNVTINERSRKNQDVDRGFMDEQVFDAEYMSAPTGGGGSIPALSNQLPYTVYYIAAPGSTNGTRLPIYSYNPSNQNFTAVDSSLLSSTATLAYSPPDKSDVFTITFAGAGSAAMAVNASGALVVSGVSQGMPDNSQVPRLDFYYGNTWCGSITSTGIFFASAFADGTPTGATGLFELFGGGALAVTIGAAGVQAASYDE